MDTLSTMAKYVRIPILLALVMVPILPKGAL